MSQDQRCRGNTIHGTCQSHLGTCHASITNHVSYVGTVTNQSMSVWQAKTAALFDAVLAQNINATRATPHMKKFLAHSTQPEPRDVKELDQECRDLRALLRDQSKKLNEALQQLERFKLLAAQVDRIESFLRDETDGYGDHTEEDEDEDGDYEQDFIDDDDDVPALSNLYVDDVDMDKSKRKRAEEPGPNKRVKIEVVSDDE